MQIAALKPFHLAARFIDVVTARRLSQDERSEVEGWLRSEEIDPYFAQPAADQRHGLVAARKVGAQVPDRLDLIRAALLHDVGKRHARLGAWGRIVGTLLQIGGITGGGRFGAYRRHGEIGATELLELGAEPLVVAYARHHHGQRPPEITPDIWELLDSADRARPVKTFIRRSTNQNGQTYDL